jgi:hypothetical protein
MQSPSDMSEDPTCDTSERPDRNGHNQGNTNLTDGKHLQTVVWHQMWVFLAEEMVQLLFKKVFHQDGYASCKGKDKSNLSRECTSELLKDKDEASDEHVEASRDSSSSAYDTEDT